jgi:uncharacterized protein
MRYYPTVGKSIQIVLIVIGLSIAASPAFWLKPWIGGEAVTFVYYIIAMGGSLLLINGIRKRETGNSHFKFEWPPRASLPFLVGGTLVLLFGIAGPLSSLIPVPESMAGQFREALSQRGIFTFLYFVVAAPVLEELIFRGIMLDGLLRNYSTLKSILTSSLLFGIVHMNPWQFVTGFVLGCFLGWVYHRTRSMTPCIIIHMTANLGGYVARWLFDFRLDTQTPLMEQGGGWTRFVAVLIGAAVIGGAAIAYLHRRLPPREKITVAAAAATA